MYQGKRSEPPAPIWRLVAVIALTVVLLAAAVFAVLLIRQSAAQQPQPGQLSPSLPPQSAPAATQELPPDPSLEPTPTATPGQAERILADMTLHEKVCQLFVVQPSDITGTLIVTAAGETTQQALERWPVGGLLYDAKNLVSLDQTHTMLTNSQSYSKIPLILTCDEEGGRVNRLMHTVGTTYIGPMLDYKDQGPDTAADNAKTIAADMRFCGFNMDLAPVADVWSNPENTVIGDRAYSDDFEQAAILVSAAVDGFHRGGVACTLKHFPGHGDTSADSHYGSVYVYKTLDQLRDAEFLPFQAGIDAGADAVMMGHLILPELDDKPALLSHKVVTELLREELGFDGVVITDSLKMQAMTDHYGSGDIAVGAVQAGVDLLLCPQNLDEAVSALTQAVENGAITQERLDESVLRVLRLKINRGIIPAE